MVHMVLQEVPGDLTVRAVDHLVQAAGPMDHMVPPAEAVVLTARMVHRAADVNHTALMDRADQVADHMDQRVHPESSMCSLCM